MGEVGTAPVSVRMLGRFEVSGAGEDLTPPVGRAATVVKVLALRGAVTAEAAIDLLWGDCDPDTGRARAPQPPQPGPQRQRTDRRTQRRSAAARSWSRRRRRSVRTCRRTGRRHRSCRSDRRRSGGARDLRGRPVAGRSLRGLGDVRPGAPPTSAPRARSTSSPATRSSTSSSTKRSDCSTSGSMPNRTTSWRYRAAAEALRTQGRAPRLRLRSPREGCSARESWGSPPTPSSSRSRRRRATSLAEASADGRCRVRRPRHGRDGRRTVVGRDSGWLQVVDSEPATETRC